MHKKNNLSNTNKISQKNEIKKKDLLTTQLTTKHYRSKYILKIEYIKLLNYTFTLYVPQNESILDSSFKKSLRTKVFIRYGIIVKHNS